MRLSPDCGWAITVCVEQDIEDGIRDGDDPMSAKMLEARRTTFGVAWPHEGKRGWTCKTQKVICPAFTNLIELTKGLIDDRSWVVLLSNGGE